MPIFRAMKHIIITLSLCLAVSAAAAQATLDSLYFSNINYRLVGPFRGGRATTACGSLLNPKLYYMGSTGGGVWRSRDAGANWENISDKYFGGSIGSVALAPSNENIIYVGEGENTFRGNVSSGINGMWKSTNAGRTWQNIGLSFGKHITKIIVHPTDPNTVWAAVFGPIFGTSQQRGVYKTTDGGKNWRRVLATANETTGAIEITSEPNNPDVMYASLWQMKRTHHNMESGGIGSGIYKSEDGGETWRCINKHQGLPKDSIWGITYVAIAPGNADKVYALVEAKDGGLFVSNDAAKTWTKVNSEANIRQRAWYFSKMAVDPSNEDKIWICNVEFWKSTDGGKSISRVSTPHGDHHNIWIDPNNAKRMIICDDGGAQVSEDAGESFSTYFNQPTSQIYRISADNAYPYRLLGGQQDNSSVRIMSRTKHSGIFNSDFNATAGGEAGCDVADPLNPDIVYGGEYDGIMRRLDHRTGEVRHINVWPESNIGSGAENLQYRFQWNYPLFFSTHNPKRLYAAGNCLFASEDEGITWQKLSDDLTTNNKALQQASGGPITKDNTTVEYYCTIFAAAESSHDADVIYTGSDDGLLHVTQNGGKTWTNITPKGCPELMMWNCIEVDPNDKATVYAVGTKYKLGDLRPYIFKSNNYGATWTAITKGIPAQHFARCIRADRKVKGLLYCGTEYGMYISYDAGASWHKFQLNLPQVPITDMCIKYNDLCVATQGRAIWVLDDLSLVQQYATYPSKNKIHVFDINDYITTEGYRAENTKRAAGMNPHNGVYVNFAIPNLKDTSAVSISIYNEQHQHIATYTKGGAEEAALKVKEGLNQFVWSTIYPYKDKLQDLVMWGGPIYSGPKAVPGKYFARLRVDADSTEKPFYIVPNPTYKTPVADYQAQFNFLMAVQKEYDSVQGTIVKLRDIRRQIGAFTGLHGDKCSKEIKTLADSINKQLSSIEEALYQTKAKSGQDVLNYPIKLNDKLATLYNQANDGYSAPTKASQEVLKSLQQRSYAVLAEFDKVLNKDVPALNTLIKQSTLNVIDVKH
ncbi:MAG: hypothetical protein RL660_1942 [Bacteroidota bacterium]|jgi:photosystem II stability/assembly factor-like uncharacterized protein